jgi:hypothetical protein
MSIPKATDGANGLGFDALRSQISPLKSALRLEYRALLPGWVRGRLPEPDAFLGIIF